MNERSEHKSDGKGDVGDAMRAVPVVEDRVRKALDSLIEHLNQRSFANRVGGDDIVMVPRKDLLTLLFVFLADHDLIELLDQLEQYR